MKSRSSQTPFFQAEQKEVHGIVETRAHLQISSLLLFIFLGSKQVK